jgi:stage V sporulation protein K
VEKLREKLQGLKGNGRDVRNILEQAMRRQAVRLESLSHVKRDDLMTIKPEDLE